MCEQTGVTVMLVFLDSGDFTSSIPENWGNNPFSISILLVKYYLFDQKRCCKWRSMQCPYGHLHKHYCCQVYPHLFYFILIFEIKLDIQNMYRYGIARWGYSPAVQSWELFNEVDLVDDFMSRENDAINFHKKFARTPPPPPFTFEF